MCTGIVEHGAAAKKVDMLEGIPRGVLMSCGRRGICHRATSLRERNRGGGHHMVVGKVSAKRWIIDKRLERGNGTRAVVVVNYDSCPSKVHGHYTLLHPQKQKHKNKKTCLRFDDNKKRKKHQKPKKLFCPRPCVSITIPKIPSPTYVFNPVSLFCEKKKNYKKKVETLSPGHYFDSRREGSTLTTPRKVASELMRKLPKMLPSPPHPNSAVFAVVEEDALNFARWFAVRVCVRVFYALCLIASQNKNKKSFVVCSRISRTSQGRMVNPTSLSSLLSLVVKPKYLKPVKFRYGDDGTVIC